MSHSLTHRPVVWLAIGLLIGLVAGGLWPDSPAHAVATSQQDNLIVCTGDVDGEGEAVYVLDGVTGNLKTYVLNPQGFFTIIYKNNVIRDLQLDLTKSPKYSVVTGFQRFRRAGAGNQWGNAVLYVAELTSGKMIAYAMPWNRAARNSNAVTDNLSLVPVNGGTAVQFRDKIVREVGGGAP